MQRPVYTASSAGTGHFSNLLKPAARPFPVLRKRVPHPEPLANAADSAFAEFGCSADGSVST